jgi:hypothetical protein
MNCYVGAILTFVATTVALLHVATFIPSSDENNSSRNGTTSSLLLLLRGSGRLITQESPLTKSSIVNHERHTKLLPPLPPPPVLHSLWADEYSNYDDSGPTSELVVQAASTLRALLPTANTPPASITTTAATTATTGVMNNLVILVRFADHANRELPSQADVHRLYNSMSTPIFDPTDAVVPTG